jgi:hypothetical protein
MLTGNTESPGPGNTQLFLRGSKINIRSAPCSGGVNAAILSVLSGRLLPQADVRRDSVGHFRYYSPVSTNGAQKYGLV